MEFDRQYRLYNPEKQSVNIRIIGAGSTGSFIALTLAKMGMQNIKIIDFDKVEAHNIPNQFYRLSDQESLKVDALQKIIKDFTGSQIQTENTLIDEKYEWDVDSNTLIILCVDNMEARKIIYEQLKDIPIRILDTRMGGEGFSIHVVDLSDDEQKEKFEKGLEGEIKETSCGEKAIIYTVLSIAAETCNIVKKIDKQEEYPKILRRELKTYRFIAG